MKTISRTGLFAILFLALIFSSCQNETIQEIPNDPQENVSEGSDLLIYLRSSTDSETNNNIEDDCVDFEFPITFLVYDADWEFMQTIVAESDQDIWNVLDMIDESTYVSINYPVTLIYQNEVILTVNNNQELLEAFETYDGGCYDLEVLFGCAIDALTVIDVEIQDDVSPTDGIHAFSLDLEFFCNDIEYELQYFETTQDAESQTNPIVFPYTNNTNPQTIYVVATTEYEDVVVSSNVFEINVIIVDGQSSVINCEIGEITNTLADFCWVIDFIDFNEFIYNLYSDGTYQLQDVGGNSDGSLLTSGVWSVVAGNDTFYITLNAELTEYNDEWVVTQCNTDLGYAYLEMQSLIYPQADIDYNTCDYGGDDEDYDCSTVEGTSNILTECPWIVDFNGSSNEYTYFFYIDGTFQVLSDNNIVTTGTWEFEMTNNGYVIEINAESPNFSDTWVVDDCDEEMGLTIGSTEYPQADIYSVDCD